ncbi:DASH family cryptochrome [Pseudidiomarina marina]|uniref:Cryptochrome DASH n=1 Tax=Pseudidiomarina marina TaxID=502366 RepID=A0A432YE87_9GAMM|nr:DASH family cryptochrome [Pseudidiomarina marina]PHR66288.1 MAG: deoxyribodipyrimidine photolyase [Idiomarina sp.]RUO59257.1 deoxyribodipyrimidine photolyase [Pseudidiomarina marina]
MKHRVGLIWFESDLRVADHPLLHLAQQECQQLICLYCVNPKWFKPNRYGLRSIGEKRWQFLQQTLADLDQQLANLGQHLFVSYEAPLAAVAKLISQYGIDVIYRSHHSGTYERQYYDIVRERYPFLDYVQADATTLFERAQLAEMVTELPESFSKFRKHIEGSNLRATIQTPLAPPTQLPPPPTTLGRTTWVNQASPTEFVGGSRAGLTHIHNYFAGSFAQTYKQTRNALDNWNDSTKFSAWLAVGAVSPRQILFQLTTHETEQGANDSTYWIFIELLWREYFHWYAHYHNKKLFAFEGIQQRRPTTSFYPARFQKWCQGNTPYPIVNACMKQLNETGYMSNRGRQLVASCFVHELGLDWRYGAAYFEQQLIDYDVAANWGNWQYLAGVGADPRGHRWFDLAKQTSMYDPQGEFIHRWQGNTFDARLDHIDAADWPIS